MGSLTVVGMCGLTHFLVFAAPVASERSLDTTLSSTELATRVEESAANYPHKKPSYAQQASKVSKPTSAGPALLCALLAPGRLPSGSTDQSWVSWRKLPEPNICDYIILDIEANPDGSYNESEYSFLLNYNTTARFLFTFGSESFLEAKAAFRRTSFRKSATQLYKTPGVRGFGLLDGDTGTNGWALTDAAIRRAVQLFSQLTRGLVAAGYKKSVISNFLGLRPVGLRGHLKSFSSLLAALDGVVDFLILLSISAPRPTCFVEGLSAWNHRDCFMNDDVQPTFELCLELIFSVDTTVSRFVLTLSLRIDAFVDVDESSGAGRSFFKNKAAGKQCYARVHRFVRRGVCPPVEKDEGNVMSTGSPGLCNFDASRSQNEWLVYTFETRASIEKTMVTVHERLAAKNVSTLSWLIYNVTSYVADDSCPAGTSRMHRAWEVAKRFRQ
ncbi:uncharacterized protein [Dermacentor albipictus]|uniref:uncharacterized protein n=1 Tax=Dermacentor albipictus TaxID=60249 RepID=UPI0031FD31B8